MAGITPLKAKTEKEKARDIHKVKSRAGVLLLDEISVGVDVELREGFVDLCDLILDSLLVALVLPGAHLLQQVFVATLHEDKGALHGFLAESTWRHNDSPFDC